MMPRFSLRLVLSALLIGGVCACSSDEASGDAPASGGMGGAGAAAAGSGGASSAGQGGAAGIAGMGTGGMVVVAGVGGGGGSGGVLAGTGGMSTGGSAPEADAAVDAEMPTGGRPPASSLDLPTTMEAAGVEPWFNIYRPMDLSATGEPLPVIVWANGGCFRADVWGTLHTRWAKAGFVVLALAESPADGALGQTTAEDHGKLIDWTIAEATKANSPYEGKLDLDHIVAAGNSCGGVTALNLTAGDDRVAAVFVLSGSSAIGAADAAVMGAIKVPTGFIVGSPEEDIANGPANMDYELLPDGVPGMVVNRTTGDHVTVSTDEAILKQEAEIALHWMDLALYGTKEAADALKTPDLCSICEAGTWVIKSKHLDTLVK